MNEPITKYPIDDSMKTVLDAGRALGQPWDVPSNESVVVVPERYSVQALEKVIAPYLKAPRRVVASVRLETAESFLRYVERFKYKTTTIFCINPPRAENANPRFLAVLDYHDAAASPAWCDHKATYECRFTPEWLKLEKQDRKRMTQEEFAVWLEENQRMVVEPPGAELLEFIQTLEGKNNIICNSMIRLANGRQQVRYSEEVELKGSVSSREGSMDVPTALALAVAPFDGGPIYNVRCRLKYRIPNRRLEFWFEAIDLHLVVKDALQGVVGAIKETLKIEPLFGAP